MSQLSNDFYQQYVAVSVVGKRRGYLILPSFAVTGLTWPGNSVVCRQYNYACTKNFTIRQLPTKPTSPDYLPVIKYRVGNEVYRYKLWTVTETEVPGVSWIPLYNGEVIKKNCSIEIWTTNGTTATNAADITLQISITRATATITDGATFEDADETAVTDMKSTNNPLTEVDPAVFTTLETYWKTSTANSVSAVGDSDPVNYFRPFIGAGLPDLVSPNFPDTPLYDAADYLIADKRALKFRAGDEGMACTLGAVAFGHVVILMKQDGYTADNVICRGTTDIYLKQSNSSGEITCPGGGEVVCPLGTWFIVEFKKVAANDFRIKATNLNTGVVQQVIMADPGLSNIGDFNLGYTSNCALMSVAAVALKLTSEITGAEYTALIQDLRYYYNNILLPLEYSAAQVVPNNS